MNGVDPIEFGKVLGALEAIKHEIKELRERTVWRLDDVEGRLEEIEKYQRECKQWREIQDHEHNKPKVPSLADKLASKVVWGTMGAAAVVLFKALGVL